MATLFNLYRASTIVSKRILPFTKCISTKNKSMPVAIHCQSNFDNNHNGHNSNIYRFNSTATKAAALSINNITSSSNNSRVGKKTNIVNVNTARSETKLTTLHEAKEIADETKKVYNNILSQQKETNSDIDGHDDHKAYTNWMDSEIKLSDAYSKAIKYTARLRSKDTALKSRLLLDEMISRQGVYSKSSLFSVNTFKDGNDIFIHDDAISEMITTIQFGRNDTDNDIMSKNSKEGTSIDSGTSTSTSTNNMVLFPTRRDYHNIIHSWASSKAKKKGLHAEMMLWRMMELSTLYPELDFPDSRIFALVVKSYAGSTCA